MRLVSSVLWLLVVSRSHAFVSLSHIRCRKETYHEQRFQWPYGRPCIRSHWPTSMYYVRRSYVFGIRKWSLFSVLFHFSPHLDVDWARQKGSPPPFPHSPPRLPIHWALSCLLFLCASFFALKHTLSTPSRAKPSRSTAPHNKYLDPAVIENRSHVGSSIETHSK